MKTRDQPADHPPGPTGSSSGASNTRKGKGSLVTMGSAAVIAVYAAGFARTRDAAETMEREATSRPSRGASAPAIPLGTSDTTRAVIATPLMDSTVLDAALHTAPVPSAPSETPATNLPVLTPTPPAPAKTTPAASPVPATATPETTTTAPVAAVVTDSALPAVTPPSAPSPAADTVKAAADSVPRKLAPLHDGTFSGYGTSRHGDIEATIEIRDGRIASASISKCLTRYSCSWIEQLPAQVVARQTADVDIVSGATQSSDAFYLAVLDAMNTSRASGR